MKKNILSFSVLFACSVIMCGTISAKKTYPVDENSREVKRLTFDCEQVTVVYADGEVRSNVTHTTIKNPNSSGVDEIGVTDKIADNAIEVFDLQGRRVADVSRIGQGIYIVREGNKVYKLIKK